MLQGNEMETIKQPINLFWCCMLLHLVADYYLQGCLADLKQKCWWQKQVYQFERSKYRYDYVAGLLCHALMWSLITFIPMMFLVTQEWFAGIIICNTLIHAWIDNLKANKRFINLYEDQIFHVIQIILTVVVCV